MFANTIESVELRKLQIFHFPHVIIRYFGSECIGIVSAVTTTSGFVNQQASPGLGNQNLLFEAI